MRRRRPEQRPLAPAGLGGRLRERPARHRGAFCGVPPPAPPPSGRRLRPAPPRPGSSRAAPHLTSATWLARRGLPPSEALLGLPARPASSSRPPVRRFPSPAAPPAPQLPPPSLGLPATGPARQGARQHGASPTQGQAAGMGAAQPPPHQGTRPDW